MIKITFDHINKTIIEQALSRLSGMPMDLKAGYTLAKIKRKVSDAIAERRDSYSKAVRAAAEKDEKGEMVRGPDGMPVIPEANRDALAATTKAVTEGELVIDWRPLEYSEIAGLQLTANEVEALAPIINGLEEAVMAGVLTPAAEANA